MFFDPNPVNINLNYILSNAIIRAIPNAADERKKLQVSDFILTSFIAINVRIKITEIISNWPASIPKLKAINGQVAFNIEPRSDFNKTENPSPWINPNRRAIEKFNHKLFFLRDPNVIKLYKAVIRMVQGIKNSTTGTLTLTTSNTLIIRVIECPNVKEVIRIKTFLQSFSS